MIPMPAEKSQTQKMKELFLTYFVSMLFAFTGGNVTWPLVQEKLSEKYKLISKEKAWEFFALGQSLPGVPSLNAGILIGRSVAGWPGGIAAAAGNILPAFCAMLLIAVSYNAIKEVHFITAAIEGIRAASIAIILANSLNMMQQIKRRLHWGIVAFAFAATFILGWNILLVIVLCGAAGVVAAVWSKNRGVDEVDEKEAD